MVTTGKCSLEKGLSISPRFLGASLAIVDRSEVFTPKKWSDGLGDGGSR